MSTKAPVIGTLRGLSVQYSIHPEEHLGARCINSSSGPEFHAAPKRHSVQQTEKVVLKVRRSAFPPCLDPHSAIEDSLRGDPL